MECRVNPPVGAAFYPIYIIRLDFDACRWQEGGPFIPGTLFNFGGNSKEEYGSILALIYPSPMAPNTSLRTFARSYRSIRVQRFEEEIERVAA